MNEILFLLFAFFTVFLSIKLSYYADALSKSSKVSGAFVGGVFLASVTSLPELVTCFSSIAIKNNALAVGDILGSNIFNIFMISFFDLVFIKKMIFAKTDKSHSLIFIILLINYFFLYLFITRILNVSIYYLGVPTFIIFFTYFYYLYRISKEKNNSRVVINDYNLDSIGLKITITAIFMIICSVILTILVNNISVTYSYFSSSFLGAIFLGITTSLPEVVTCYTLISMDSYDLALSDIIGSNLFNLFVIALADFFVRSASIYSFTDKDEIFLAGLGFIFTLLLFISNRFKNNYFKRVYGLLSVVIVIMYLGYWILNFLY